MTKDRSKRPFLNTASISSRITLDKQLCLFGIGELMRSCFDQLVLVCGRQPNMICDNDPQYWGKTYRGIPVVSPKNLFKSDASAPIVVITIKEYESVFQQLLQLGVDNIIVAIYERSLFRLSDLREIRANDADKIYHDDNSKEYIAEKLAGRWALVTGSARGLGAEIARVLADSGVYLILHGRSFESISKTLAYCLTKGVKAMPVTADLLDISSVESLGRSIGTDFPLVDILINNAAISPPADLSDFPYASTELFEKCLRVNALAPIVLNNLILPQMLKRGQGRVVNITSSIRGNPSALHYACSKAALDKYVIDLYESLQGSGVSISMVDPGWIRTPMTGFKGLHGARSAINGVLLPMLLDLNGCWISSHDYYGMNIHSAIKKARQIYSTSNKELP